MKTVKQKLSQLINKLTGKQLDFRVRLFSILAVAGVIVSILMALLCLWTGAGIGHITVNLIIAGFSYALLSYSHRSGKYQRCYTIAIFFIFLVLFPALFFTAGGYYSSMPSFFVFAVMFTVFMIEGRRMFALAALEIATYVGICLFAYHFPGSVRFFPSEKDIVSDIIIGFTAVSIVMGVTLYQHFKLYNEQQRELEAARICLSEENATLEQINRLKTEFLGNISHELKTPLTVVRAYVQDSEKNLSSANEHEETAKNLKIAASETDRLALLVSQILDISRIDENRLTLDAMPHYVTKIAQDTLNSYSPLFTKNNNRLTFTPDSGIPRANCDRNRVAQVLINLITNAARHTRNGEINVSISKDDDFVAVTVRDNGEGIAPEQLPYLFERYKAHDAKRDKNHAGAGTGLGLFICKYIVEAHGGQITVNSKLGAGTEVMFTLPLQTEP